MVRDATDKEALLCATFTAELTELVRLISLADEAEIVIVHAAYLFLILAIVAGNLEIRLRRKCQIISSKSSKA